jgi:hypothetical protein
MPETAMMALLQPLVQPDETVVLIGDGQASPLEPHDGLTMALKRLMGGWRPQLVVVALTDRHLHWLEMSPQGVLATRRAYRLPLKGRLVLQRRGVLERQFPGEPRCFLTTVDPDLAAALYRRIDDDQQATQRAHELVPEVIGVGVKPAQGSLPSTRGPHGETTVAQHEMVAEIRPSYRPKTSSP